MCNLLGECPKKTEDNKGFFFFHVKHYNSFANLNLMITGLKNIQNARTLNEQPMGDMYFSTRESTDFKDR